MLNKIIKIVLTAGLLAWSVFQFIEGNIGNGILLVLLVALVVLLIFRHEMLLIAFWFVRKGDMEKAEKYLDMIKQPQHLIRAQEAYYYFMRGLTTSQKGGVFEAEKFFKKALNTGLRMSHDRAMAKLSLAGAAMSRRRKREAQNLITEAKKLDKHGLLDEQIKLMKEQMKRV